LACVKILVAGGSYIDIRNNYNQTPLSYAIFNNKCETAQFLLYSGAKISNVAPNIEIPDWMNQMVMTRKRTIHSTLTLKGVLRKRYKVDGAESSFLNGGIPKDMVNLVGYHVLSTWLDPKWG
jgi:ankyrin repeat protein